MSCPYHYAMNASVIRAPAYPQIQFIITLKGSELLRLACNSLRIPTYSYCSGRTPGKLYVIDVFTKPLCFRKLAVLFPVRASCPYSLPKISLLSVPARTPEMPFRHSWQGKPAAGKAFAPYVRHGCRKRHSAIVGGENRRRARYLTRGVLSVPLG